MYVNPEEVKINNVDRSKDVSVGSTLDKQQYFSVLTKNTVKLTKYTRAMDVISKMARHYSRISLGTA